MLEDMQEWPHFGKEDQACAEATIAELRAVPEWSDTLKTCESLMRTPT